MNFLKLGLILSTILMFIVACNQTQMSDANLAKNTAVVANVNAVNAQSPATDELASTHKIYSQTCVNCHKEDGRGGVSTIDGKKIKAPDFTSQRMIKDDDADWIETIENGAPEDGMPAFKNRLSSDEIKNLVKMIRKDFQGKQ